MLPRLMHNLAFLSLTAVLALLTVACGQDADVGKSHDGIAQLHIWVHSGQARERETVEQQVERFNASQSDIRATLTLIPENSYNAQIQAAAVAGDLPDLLEFDGPFLYNYVWQGHLRPLDGLLTKATLDDLLPSIIRQGTYKGRLYSVGAFDSGLGLYGRTSLLKKAGARIPTGPGDAWSEEEFESLLKSLAWRDDDGAVLDLKLNYKGEWFTYAFSPIIHSAGGDLIDRTSYLSSRNVLNGPAVSNAMTRVQQWITGGMVDPNLDDNAFVHGRVALSWAGHWEYPRYAQALAKDLVLLPLPNFGVGARTGQGSWNWGITNRCEHPSVAATFLQFLLQPDEVLAMSRANGAVPGTKTAIARSKLYGANGPLELFASQLRDGYSVPRPETPAYPVITSAFQQAFLDIRNGVDVQRALDKATAVIDQDIVDNHGYPVLEK